MKLYTLTQMVEAVCPIHGINSAGFISFKNEATEVQRADAASIVSGNIAKIDNLPSMVDQIKAKAGQIILARLPDYKQRNYLARKAELQDVLIAGSPLAANEQAEWDFFATEWAWAKSIRAASNEAEAAGTPVDEVVWPT